MLISSTSAAIGQCVETIECNPIIKVNISSSVSQVYTLAVPAKELFVILCESKNLDLTWSFVLLARFLIDSHCVHIEDSFYY